MATASAAQWTATSLRVTVRCRVRAKPPPPHIAVRFTGDSQHVGQRSAALHGALAASPGRELGRVRRVGLD